MKRLLIIVFVLFSGIAPAAVKTTAQAGPASDGATWVGGVVPASGDSWVLNHDITLDADWTAVNVAGISGAGVLTFSTAPGTYGFNVTAGGITCGGLVIRGATHGEAYPADCTAIITTTFNGSIVNISADGAIDIQCQEPEVKYAALTVQGVAGNTTLTVDQDLTGWSGDVRVDGVNPNYYQSDAHTIASASNGEIVLTSGLTRTKPVGSLVILLTRNIRIQGNSGSAQYAFGDRCLNATIGADIRAFNRGVAYGSGHAIIGVMSGCVYGAYSCVGISVECVMSGISVRSVSDTHASIFSNCLFSGCLQSVYLGSSSTFKCCEFSGNQQAVFLGNSLDFNGCEFGGNQYSIYLGSGIVFVASKNANNLVDLYRTNIATSSNTLFDGATEFVGYNSSYRAAWGYVESLDHDQVSGAFRAWCRGGIVDRVSDVFPPMQTSSYLHSCESADFPCFRQTTLEVMSGETLEVIAWFRKNASTPTLPKLEIISFWADPLVDNTQTALASWTMTDSTDTWERGRITWENTGDDPARVIVRASAQDATASVWEWWAIRKQPGLRGKGAGYGFGVR